MGAKNPYIYAHVHNNVTRFAKRGLIYMHSFKTHFSLPVDNYINVPTAHVLMLLKVEQSAFIQASFSSLSNVHKCSGGLQMAYLLLTSRQPTVIHYTTG